MIYICHRPYSGKGLSGEVEIQRADLLRETNGMLYYKNEPVCLTASENGKMHFARHDDGKGLRRGELTREITKRRRAPAKYYQPSGIGFTAELYAEEIPVLEAILEEG